MMSTSPPFRSRRGEGAARDVRWSASPMGTRLQV